MEPSRKLVYAATNDPAENQGLKAFGNYSEYKLLFRKLGCWSIPSSSPCITTGSIL